MALHCFCAINVHLYACIHDKVQVQPGLVGSSSPAQQDQAHLAKFGTFTQYMRCKDMPRRCLVATAASQFDIASSALKIKYRSSVVSVAILHHSCLATGSSRSHCVVYLMVEKSYSDGKLEYGKLSLVGVPLSAVPFTVAVACVHCPKPRCHWLAS